eukprot:21089-Alexandrium_andersonii.AAC.1
MSRGCPSGPAHMTSEGRKDEMGGHRAGGKPVRGSGHIPVAMAEQQWPVAVGSAVLEAGPPVVTASAFRRSLSRPAKQAGWTACCSRLGQQSHSQRQPRGSPRLRGCDSE